MGRGYTQHHDSRNKGGGFRKFLARLGKLYYDLLYVDGITKIISAVSIPSLKDDGSKTPAIVHFRTAGYSSSSFPYLVGKSSI